MKSHGEKHPYNHAKVPTSENLRHEAHRKKHEKLHDTPSTAAPPTVRKRASAQVPLPHQNIQPGIYRPLFLPPREATIKDAPLRTEKGQIQNQSSRRWTGRLQRLQGRPCRPYAVANPFPRFTVEHEGFSPLNPFTDYLFVVPHAAHFRFITLFITRMDETNFSVEVNTSTFHTCEERPLCTIVATALTVSPS